MQRAVALKAEILKRYCLIIAIIQKNIGSVQTENKSKKNYNTDQDNMKVLLIITHIKNERTEM